MMEVRQNRLPVMPPNYVTLNDLKERYLKEQQERKQREADEATAAEKAVPVMPVENIAAVDRRSINQVTTEENRERKGKAVVEEGEDRERREKAGKAVVDEGEDRGRREKAYAEEVCRSGALHAEKGENRRWREKAAMEDGGEGGYRRRRERAGAETQNVEEGGYRKRREKAATEDGEEGGYRRRRERAGAETENAEEGGYRKRREKAESWRREKIGVKGKAEETLGEGADNVRLEEGDNRKRSEKNKGKKKTDNNNNNNNNNKETDNVEEPRDERTEEEKVLAALVGGEEERETVVINGRVWMKKVTWVAVDEIEQGFGDLSLRDRNGGGDRDFRRENPTNEVKLKIRDDKKDVQGDRIAENGGRIGNNSKNNRKKGKGFRKNRGGDGRVEDMPVVVQRGGDVRDDEKIVLGDRRAENGRGGDPTAEIGVKSSDFATSDKKKGGESSDVKENVEGGRKGEIGRRIGERRRIGDSKGGNGGRNGVVRGGLGCYKSLDSSLVWVRKEEKSEVCVAGNCSEGVLAKAGESEKRPGRGRP